MKEQQIETEETKKQVDDHSHWCRWDENREQLLVGYSVVGTWTSWISEQMSFNVWSVLVLS